MQRYRTYLIAAVLAVLMTVFIAPECNEGNAMSPVLKDGDVVVLLKETYSENRGMPEKGDLVVLKKGTFGEQHEEDHPIRIVTGLPGDTMEMKDGSMVKIKADQVFISSYKSDSDENDSSQVGTGPIDSSQVRGKVIVRLWPLDNIGGF